ncbi:FecR protein [Fuerstiella marisgermanici]|uniref:FecR protein n=1 Tax=Fuerstiella marisgermanici TaxID=1891926 RepID=A0A1P8WGE5_9PLAN|nr:FecR protein [Fuerstiella marisgermanici]
MIEGDLIRRYLDDRLSADEFAEFNERLCSDEDFRRHYVRLADMEACLYDECCELPPNSITAKNSRASQWRTLAILCSAVVACVLMLFARNLFLPGPPVEMPIGQTDPEPPAQTDVIKDPFAMDQGPAVVHPDAAVIVIAEAEDNPELITGRRLKPGIVTLKTGYTQLEFMSGAVVGLLGPGQLRIESKDAATLLSGQVTAHVPDRARGFVLNAPGAAIVDLGTEFGVRINDTGTSEVAVLNGEVELSLLGDDGNTLVSQRVNDLRTVRVDSELKVLTEMPRSSEETPRIRPSAEIPLPISDEYVNAIHEGEPLIYWRFEEADGGTIRNEVGDRWSAVLQASDTASDSIRVANGHVSFIRSDSSRFLSLSEGIAGLNEGPFSIEFWMRPDDLAHATAVGIYPESDTNASLHLNVIEIVTDTFMIHEPGALRFLHRSPPERNYEFGKNVFSAGVCVPHQWQHVVAVKNSDSLELYYNGQLAQRVQSSEMHGGGTFQLLLGELRTTVTDRQYSGALDEFAVYRRSLTPAEAARHYALGTGRK